MFIDLRGRRRKKKHMDTYQKGFLPKHLERSNSWGELNTGRVWGFMAGAGQDRWIAALPGLHAVRAGLSHCGRQMLIFPDLPLDCKDFKKTPEISQDKEREKEGWGERDWNGLRQRWREGERNTWTVRWGKREDGEGGWGRKRERGRENVREKEADRCRNRERGIWAPHFCAQSRHQKRSVTAHFPPELRLSIRMFLNRHFKQLPPINPAQSLIWHTLPCPTIRERLV